MMRESEFDYVIVGAGTSGCVLAARLAAGGRNAVLVLEAGGFDRSIWIRIPVGFSKTFMNPKYGWGYQARYNPAMGERIVPWPRGRVVGGSGSINGLVYVRGQHADFDDWQALSADGWSWRDVKPYFQRAERDAHAVSKCGYRHPVCDAFIDAAENLGYPRVDPESRDTELGAGYVHLSTDRGLRRSTAHAYLHPARRRGEVALEVEAMVERIVIENGRATGVLYRQGGEICRAKARKDVVLAAGAIGSPQLLQLSGIGPASHLLGAGIDVVQDSPQIGENLQDHLAIRLVARAKGVVTLNEMTRSFFRRAGMALEFALRRAGPMTIGAGMATLYAPVVDPSGRPDVQFMIGPLSTDNPLQGMHAFPGMTTTACQLRPRSRGFLRVMSPDPYTHPSIVANYLSDELDRQVMVAQVRMGRKLYSTPPLSDLVESEHRPGREVETDDEILDYALRMSGSIYHPVGTCRMGSDPNAPVDPELRVKGIRNLRVADGSVMPTLVSANSNAACIMIGEKAADIIVGASTPP